MLAFDIARIRSDLENGKNRSLQHYLDQLLPDAERAARTEEAFFERLDRQITGATEA